jgi:nucleotide-binding universal stress UspA family protein
MANDSNESVILRRILVAIDTSSHSEAALNAAAVLAKKMKAQIHGLFVQDETWRKICKLPSVTCVNELTGHSQTLEEQSLEEQINLLKRRLRRQLRTISRENKITHTWKTVQGRVEESILKAAEDADLITIGRRGSSFPETKKLGSSAKYIIRKADKPILILKKGLQLGESISVVYDGSEESQRCLRLALSLADTKKGLCVFVLGNKPDTAGKRSTELEELVEDAPVPVEVRLLNNPTIWNFTHAVNRRGTERLIVPKNQPLLKNELESVLYQLECPLLMMN